jgi:hypothetical protein
VQLCRRNQDCSFGAEKSNEQIAEAAHYSVCGQSSRRIRGRIDCARKSAQEELCGRTLHCSVFPTHFGMFNNSCMSQVDVINFGEENTTNDTQEKMLALIGAVNNQENR